MQSPKQMILMQGNDILNADSSIHSLVVKNGPVPSSVGWYAGMLDLAGSVALHALGGGKFIRIILCRIQSM
jgi:hypothetical protein